MSRYAYGIMAVFAAFSISTAAWAYSSMKPDDQKGKTPSNEEAIEAVLSAHGGRTNILKISSVKAAGKIDAFMLGDKGSYEYIYQRPDKLRVDTVYTHSSERRILNGGKGYRSQNGSEFSEVSGMSYEGMYFQFLRADLLYLLSVGRYQVLGSGNASLAGTALKAFRVKLDGTMIVDVLIDPETNLIRMVNAVFGDSANVTNLAAEYLDYSGHEGVMFPMKIVSHASGRVIAETYIETYRINPGISPEVFVPGP